MKIGDLGITAAKGFSATGGAVGIKKGGTKDMALIYSSAPCKVAGCFTTNLVKAAPVLWDRHIVRDVKKGQAVVINSGIANACTGQEGYQDCQDTAKAAAKVLGIEEDAVLVASTGVIGQRLPIEKLTAGVELLAPTLSESREAAALAAKAIMTTDTRPKEVSVTIELGGKEVTLGGMCKGAGMIHPNMGTMLSFIGTDAAIDQELLQEALSAVVPDTYNMISVDGDTSTNDTVVVLANGLAGNPEIKEKNDDYKAFCEALYQVNVTLAKKIAGDGEGASRLFEVQVKGAVNDAQARILAKSVVTSTLTKAAIFGKDANWGRILCALGYSGASFDPEKVELWFKSDRGTIKIAEKGTATNYSEEEATQILGADEVTAICDVHAGNAEATAWGCDLTYDYVKINADYRS
ncbi:MAG: bifunctional glutamate N-acetyltransferase/amino-acid acetyltransferase ArgJ [Eubacterium sp.]|nr:bifunctional glutamate N-acetyltransferase/amino-acid acetyltransferase ArgJ [Eubacterium sp.]